MANVFDEVMLALEKAIRALAVEVLERREVNASSQRRGERVDVPTPRPIRYSDTDMMRARDGGSRRL